MSDASIKTILGRLDKLTSQVTKLDGTVSAAEKRHEERTAEVLKLAREAIDLFVPVKAVVDELRDRVERLEGKTVRRKA